MDTYNRQPISLAVGLVVVIVGLFIAILNVDLILAYAQNSFPPPSSLILSKNSISGSLSSLQNDVTGETNWLIGGVYNISNINTANPTFNAIFDMMKTDGTQLHKHIISDFKTSGNPVVTNNSTTFNGTSSITMKEGSIKDVPTSIKFTDRSAVSLWFDQTKTKSHFGNTVIYGTQHVLCKEMPNYC